MKKVVIVGGGFAGINLIKSLSGSKDFEVVLVDKNNYHFFPPLLYQVSTAFIEASNISYPFRRFFHHQSNIHFYMGSLLKIVPEIRTIETDNGSLTYDYLVLAMGTETNYFGNENIKRFAMPMKTIDDALHLRNHILLQLERAVRSTSLIDKEKYANIVIAGAGPTGVELAGMLAEMARNIVAKDYPEAWAGVGSIYLIDGTSSILSLMSKKSQQEAKRVLESLGVKILLNTLVKDYADDNQVRLSNGEAIPAATLIWASGVIAREAKGLAPEAVTRGRRIIVDDINRVMGATNIFCLGDQCFQSTDPNYPNGHPQVAQVAIQQGILLSKNLKSLAFNRSTSAFRYHNKGNMAIISKYKAVVELPKGFFKGFFAWLAWLFIHIIPIAGFRNKLKLAFNWFWSFMTNDPTLRLVIRPETSTQ